MTAGQAGQAWDRFPASVNIDITEEKRRTAKTCYYYSFQQEEYIRTIKSNFFTWLAVSHICVEISGRSRLFDGVAFNHMAIYWRQWAANFSKYLFMCFGHETKEKSPTRLRDSQHSVLEWEGISLQVLWIREACWHQKRARRMKWNTPNGVHYSIPHFHVGDVQYNLMTCSTPLSHCYRKAYLD